MQLPLKQKTSGSYPDGGTYVPVMALPSKHVVHNGEWESESPQECLLPDSYNGQYNSSTHY